MKNKDEQSMEDRASGVSPAPKLDASRYTPNSLPIGDSRFAVPHYAKFGGTFGSGEWYSTRFDEALQFGGRENAQRMRLDPMITTPLEIRALPTSLLTFSIEAEDQENQREVAAAKRQEKLIKRMLWFSQLNYWLLTEGLFVGRAGAFLKYSFTPIDPLTRRQYAAPVAFDLIAGDKLQFNWAGDVAIACGGGWKPRDQQQLITTDATQAYKLTPSQRAGTIVHKGYREDTDYFKPIRAGAIHGTGIRGRLYWFWQLKNEIWKMGLDFIRWFSKGLLYYYFEYGNKAHLDEVKAWVEQQDGNSTMFFPVMRDQAGNPYFQKPVEQFLPNMSNPQFLQELITKYFDDIFRFAILHQSLTTTVGNTGMGSGTASNHQTTFDTLVKYDANQLADTYTMDMVRPMYAFNEPGVAPGYFRFKVDAPNVQQVVDSAQAIVSMGGSVVEREVKDAAGLGAGKEGDTLLTNVQPQQPTAVGQTPQNVPMVGDAAGSQPV